MPTHASVHIHMLAAQHCKKTQTHGLMEMEGIPLRHQRSLLNLHQRRTEQRFPKPTQPPAAKTGFLTQARSMVLFAVLTSVVFCLLRTTMSPSGGHEAPQKFMV